MTGILYRTTPLLHTMRRFFITRRTILALAALLLGGCSSTPPPEDGKLTVAAAANLTGVFDQVAEAFRKQTGAEVVLSYGSTAQLAKQIENGAPFDVFAAADTEHVDQLLAAGKLTAGSRAVYARGQLALWVPQAEKLGIRTLEDLKRPEIRFIALAQPELAPYGKAAIEALKAAGLWDALQPKVVYANNINMARQYAETGNADAALTAYSLVMRETGVLRVDSTLYTPIDQALGIVASSGRPDLAKRFVEFVRSTEGASILRQSGYEIPQR